MGGSSVYYLCRARTAFRDRSAERKKSRTQVGALSGSVGVGRAGIGVELDLAKLYQ